MIFFKKWFGKKTGLLPYIREDVTSLNIQTHQHYGWEIKKFNIPDIWTKTKGNNVTVAVIDTGCDLEHEDLRSNLLKGQNFVEPNEPPIDRNGHGTHVAGTIAACNNDKGMVGVAPEAKILPVKCLGDDGSGYIDDIINGIKWAVDNGADIITMSLGSPSTTKNMEKVLNYAVSKKVIVFCAAGNSGPNVDIMYPAKYDNVIAIGAIDRNLKRTSFTCSGQSLDFLAPGQDILSCVPTNSYAVMSGTSMSNPFAAACATLLLSWNKQHKKYTLDTVDDYINVFKNHCLFLEDQELQLKKYQGYGILNPSSVF